VNDTLDGDPIAVHAVKDAIVSENDLAPRPLDPLGFRDDPETFGVV
jgi:hypothetical protein